MAHFEILHARIQKVLSDGVQINLTTFFNFSFLVDESGGVDLKYILTQFFSEPSSTRLRNAI